jgi:hypothetical protein
MKDAKKKLQIRTPCLCQAGSLKAISRWLSLEQAIPPVLNAHIIRIPEGCQP